jgi:uncharacterized membrane protein SpoIIM required for sporulation
MTPARARRWAIGFWIVMAVVVWFGLYDLRITLSYRDHLMKQYRHEAGRGDPVATIKEERDPTLQDAVLVATLWAGIILVSGLGTIILLSRATRTVS